MKTLLTTLFGVFLAASLFAQTDRSIVRPIAANTVSNYLSGKYVITGIRLINSSTNTATVKFYDWSTAATNVVRPAYVTVVSYATNYNTVYTNSAGIVATNTYNGWYTGNSTVSAVTNEQTRLGEFQVTASTVRDIPFTPVVMRGLTVLADQAGSIEILYNQIP